LLKQNYWVGEIVGFFVETKLDRIKGNVCIEKNRKKGQILGVEKIGRNAKF
jgi:hypothetical protein